MEVLFRLIRMPMLPVPLLLWSIAWPILLFGIILIAIPFLLIANTALRALGLPFVFLYSAFTNKPGSLLKYFKKWQTNYRDTMALTESVSITKPYKTILAWGRNPRDVKYDTGWIVTANIVSVVLAASVYSEVVLVIVIVLVVAIVVFVLWAIS